MDNAILKIHENDNVGVALRELQAGQKEACIEIVQHVPTAHKIALKDIAAGENIIKYGCPIGRATQSITVGEHVHTHNLKTNLDKTYSYHYQPTVQKNPYAHEGLFFNGYQRKNGTVGIRNELWLIPTVGCINGLAEQIIHEFLRVEQLDRGDLAIDALQVLKHPYGCSQLGDDLSTTRSILQNLVQHPNAGGVLVFGLGCENNVLEEFIASLGVYDKDRVKFLIAQQVDDEIDVAVQQLREIYRLMSQDKRQPCPLRSLRVGLKCGGSDGFSGISANPLLGLFSDWLIAQDGATLLTEVPEMFGAETMLMNRAISYEIFEKIVEMIEQFKQYFISHNQPVYENPSPGNKAGGLSSLEDKSLGCVQKSGHERIVDVLPYTARMRCHSGVSLLNAPGNDGVSSSALAAAGCQMILFTTGRGTPFGTVVPTVKISTTSNLAERKKRWIDFDAGKVLGKQDYSTSLRQLISYLLSVANGELTQNEKNNFRELVIFKNGVTL